MFFSKAIIIVFLQYFMDYYECVIYNYILPSLNPETGMENHAKYDEAIYAKGNEGDL
ncbi:hypothetical protein ACQ9BO_18205 [Flavobacterium sp. P21]|uniref:hypothetical protein n=1 Tax=Flavobacterium sp. P21 TaxID=3423948 RepID=UPI003D6785AF